MEPAINGLWEGMLIGLVIALGLLLIIGLVARAAEFVLERTGRRGATGRTGRSFADAVADMDFERAESIAAASLRSNDPVMTTGPVDEDRSRKEATDDPRRVPRH